MSYATPTAMLRRYDSRKICQLVRDDGSVANATEILTDEVLQALLDDADGEIRFAVRAGDRYTLDELDEIAADDDKKAPLVRLACDITYGLLWIRRGLSDRELAAVAPRYVQAQQTLEMLRRGDRVFDLDTHTQANKTLVAEIGSHDDVADKYMSS